MLSHMRHYDHPAVLITALTCETAQSGFLVTHETDRAGQLGHLAEPRENFTRIGLRGKLVVADNLCINRDIPAVHPWIAAHCHTGRSRPAPDAAVSVASRSLPSMSTSKETIEFLLSQLEPLDVRARAMFGEYGLYCNEKIVALVCHDTLYLKPTEAAERFAADLTRGPAYEGSADYLAVDGDLIKTPERLQSLVKATADLLPPPKPRASRARTPS